MYHLYNYLIMLGKVGILYYWGLKSFFLIIFVQVNLNDKVYKISKFCRIFK